MFWKNQCNIGYTHMCELIEEGELLEKDIEKWLGDQVTNMGGLYYKFVSPGNRGVPDRIIVFPPGVTIFVELKTDKGRTSAIQDVQIKRLQRVGAPVRVVKGRADAERLVADIRYAKAREKVDPDFNPTGTWL